MKYISSIEVNGKKQKNLSKKILGITIILLFVVVAVFVPLKWNFCFMSIESFGFLIIQFKINDNEIISVWLPNAERACVLLFNSEIKMGNCNRAIGRESTHYPSEKYASIVWIPININRERARDWVICILRYYILMVIRLGWHSLPHILWLRFWWCRLCSSVGIVIVIAAVILSHRHNFHSIPNKNQCKSTNLDVLIRSYIVNRISRAKSYLYTHICIHHFAQARTAQYHMHNIIICIF